MSDQETIDAIREASRSVACVTPATKAQCGAILDAIKAGKVPGVAMWADLPCHAALKKVEDERDAALAEAKGYQELSQEIAKNDGKSAVVLIQGEHSMRIFAPTAGQEKEMAEAIAHWFNLVRLTEDELCAKDAEAQRDEAVAILAEAVDMMDCQDPEWDAVRRKYDALLERVGK